MEFLQITITGWVALSIAISMAFLAAVMFFLGREQTHYVWGVFCIAIAIWAGGFYMVTLSNSAAQAAFWWRISYIGTILNPFLYFHFTLELIQNKFFNKFKIAALTVLYAIALTFVYLDLTTNLIVNRITFLFGELYYDTPPGALYFYFLTFFLVLIAWSLYLIFHEYRRRQNDPLFRGRVIYFFLASAIAYVGGSMNFLPVYGIEVNPATNFAVAFGAIFIAYAVLRRGLFDVKVVTAQFLTLVLSVFALVRIFISGSIQELLFNILILGVTLAVGIYLIVSVRREVAQREHIQKLAEELELINERQETLIHFIGHEVKGFLTKAQGAFSMLVDGDMGQLPEDLKPFVARALHETEDGVTSVSDILKASNLKKGTVEFKKEPFDLKTLVTETVEKAKPAAVNKNLTLSFKAEPADSYRVNGDKEELGIHVLRNLIDNAVNYTPSGSVVVSLKKENGKFIISVKDSGIGVTDEDKKVLFTEGGHGKESQKVNVHSTGYGLYIAKQVVEAHNGTICAESEGSDKGSTFIVELPAT